jgi:lipid II:glycine glycyltransferase (peptidoglycan interpeptide bridge formation enzyme)
MFETIPSEILKLYAAEYEGKIVAANLVLFFGKMATYMHGASDNVHRDVMAPYLLQWRQVQDAKKAGCEKYDFGGVKLMDTTGKSWAGVTKFKTGFAPDIEPIQFPGCYDIILKPGRYSLYRVLQKIKRVF